MIDFFSDIHIGLQRKIGRVSSTTSSLGRICAKFFVAMDYLCIWSANAVLPIHFILSSSKHRLTNNSTQPNKRVIVSLTTFPKRLGKVWLVVESMMRQEVRPAEIHLWLSKEQIAGESQLPRSLRREMEKGLQVHFVEGDIRSHKKYYYILQSNPDDMIVTVDDDLLYRSDAIATLLRYHENYPDCVIANYARKVETDNGELSSYETWKQYDKACVDGCMFFGSGGGTLFPPHTLHKDVTKLDAIMECCPTADDIWLNAMTRLNGKRIIKTNYPKVFLPVRNKSDMALSENENAGENGNDCQIKLVREYFIQNYGIDPFECNRL